MSLGTPDTTVIDGSTTTSATISNEVTLVKLSTQDVVLTLPSVSQGKRAVVAVVAHPAVANTSGAVRVRPGTNNKLNVNTQIFGAGEYVLWELNSTVTFIGVDSNTWAVIDVL
jgi:hypothetical protein